MAVQSVPANPAEEAIISKLRRLPPEKQQEVLAFASSLDTEEALPKLKNVRGLWQNMGFTVSEEDIAEVRREMWGNFPREQFFK